jgi:hypothetical protein
MKINLNNPKEVIVVQEESKTIDTITIQRMVDVPEQKKVFVFTRELGQVVLWEGEEYDSIGQWTDQDVTDRLISLYS